MRKFVLILKPYIIGSLGITVFTLFAIAVSFFTMNNGVTYFICGITGAFGVGYFIHRLAKPVSPLTVLVIIPCMFSGTLISEYIHLSKEKIIHQMKPSEIKAHRSSLLFELSNYHVLHDKKSSYTGTWRYKDKSATIHVYTVPVVDDDWQPDDTVEVFAVCEKNFENSGDCGNAFSPDKGFAKLVVQRSTNHYKSFEVSAKKGVKDHDYKIADTITFVELISDIHLYAIKKRRYGIIIFFGLLLLWNAVSFWSVRHIHQKE